MKINLKDKAIVKELYVQSGKGEHFEKNIEPKLKSQEDLQDLVANSFGNRSTRTQFDGVLVENEFVAHLFNIYRQRLLTILKGNIPYIDMFLKDAPFSGSQGYISQDIKPGKGFTHVFDTTTFNPDRRAAFLQVISTHIRRTYDDELSIQVIGRAASKEGGLDSYISQRIAYLQEDFTAEIRKAMLTTIDNVVGKELTITVPTELQGELQKEQRARYIMEKITNELLYIADNSTDYTDNGFTSRTPKNELYGIYSRQAKAEMDIWGFGMLRNLEKSNGISVSKTATVPENELTNDFYIKFMTPRKIHYSNSVQVSGADTINKNMKVVYSKHVWTELDIVDSEPALTIKVVNGTSADVSSTVLEPNKRVVAANNRRKEFYKKLSEIYGAKAITTAPQSKIVNEDQLTI